jgi:hypothetical protein
MERISGFAVTVSHAMCKYSYKVPHAAVNAGLIGDQRTKSVHTIYCGLFWPPTFGSQPCTRHHDPCFIGSGRPSAPDLGSTNTASAAPIPENRGTHSNWAEGGYKIDDTSVGDVRYAGHEFMATCLNPTNLMCACDFMSSFAQLFRVTQACLQARHLP